MMTDHKEVTLEDGDWLQFKGIDYVEFYVGNANQSMHFYRTAFGFMPIAYAGPETGVRDRVSFTLEQHNIRLVLTSPLSSASPIAEHVNLHSDGVKDIAFTVDDAVHAFEETVKRGAQPIMEPTLIKDQDVQVIKATIAAFGDTVHSFIQRKAYDGPFFPNYRAIKDRLPTASTGLVGIDHIAISVEPGMVNQWVDYYNNVLGFHQLLAENIESDYSAMNSKVVQKAAGQMISVFVEPAPGKRKSPIDEYLTFYGGSGVHHIALSSNDIIRTVSALRANGVEFTNTPSTYYKDLEERIGKLDENTAAALRDLNILVDRDKWGYLRQIFSKPVQSRPTFFFEIIQRMGARGFGNGNIKALFKAIERDQVLRGNI